MMPKTRRTLLLAIGTLVLVATLVFLLWPRAPTPYRLKLVRQGVDQGKPVAYFRIEGGERRRIAINSVPKP